MRKSLLKVTNSFLLSSLKTSCRSKICRATETPWSCSGKEKSILSAPPCSALSPLGPSSVWSIQSTNDSSSLTSKVCWRCLRRHLLHEDLIDCQSQVAITIYYAQGTLRSQCISQSCCESQRDWKRHYIVSVEFLVHSSVMLTWNDNAISSEAVVATETLCTIVGGWTALALGVDSLQMDFFLFLNYSKWQQLKQLFS